MSGWCVATWDGEGEREAMWGEEMGEELPTSR